MEPLLLILLLANGVLLFLVIVLATGYQNSVERRLRALEEALVELRLELEFWRK
jgi:hypothetical protein